MSTKAEHPKNMAPLSASGRRDGQRPHRWWQRGWLLGLLLVAATFLVYRPAWNGEAIFDDDDHLTPPELSSLHGLARIWTELGVVSQYYPVTHSVFWLEHRMWGEWMPGYHAVNLLLHALGALLLGRVLQRLEVPGAWLAAAIFALHPVHVESVAWVSELKNTLSGVFYFSAALAYLRFDERRRRNSYLAALVLFTLGLLSKSVIATLPAALLVVFWWKRGTLSGRRDVGPLLPFFLIGSAAGTFTAWVERVFIGAEGTAFDLTPIERVLLAGRAIWFYLGKLCWPADLIFIYPRWQVSEAAGWQYWFPAAAMLLIATLWAVRRRMRGPLAGLLFFAGTLFPVLGFLNVYPFIYSYVADHYQYLASAGIIVVGSAAAALGLRRCGWWGRPAGNVLSGALLTVLASLTWQHSRTFCGTETLWRTTMARNPACFVAESNLGNYLLQKGEVDEAIRHGRIALALQPRFAEIHNNLGNALLQKDAVDEALAHYEKALELRPGLAAAHFNIGAILLQRGQRDEARVRFARAVELQPEFVKAQNNLGSLLLDIGHVDEAVAHFMKALEIRPDDTDAQTNLGNARLRQARPDEAIVHYRRVLKIQPKLAVGHHNLAMALAQQGHTNDAVVHLQKVVELEPESANAQNNLGWILRVAGRWDEASKHLQRALELRPNFAEAHTNLGKTLLLKGQMREAVAHYEAALILQPDNARALSNLAWVLATWPDTPVRNGPHAIELAERASRITGDRDLLVLQSKAAAYAECGRFTEAISTAERARRLLASHSNPNLAEELEVQLRIYRSGSPFREPVATPASSSPPRT